MGRKFSGEHEVMDKPVSDRHFEVMSLFLRFRDYFEPPQRVLDEVGITPGFHILDFGCGLGSYSIAAAELVGPSGKVYALDIHPLAVQRVQRSASKKRLTNIETIRSDCATGLADNSVDVVLLLYDVFHALSDPTSMLRELHRVLKPEGTLSFRRHGGRQDKISSRITETGLFRLIRKNRRTYDFMKIG